MKRRRENENLGRRNRPHSVGQLVYHRSVPPAEEKVKVREVEVTVYRVWIGTRISINSDTPWSWRFRLLCWLLGFKTTKNRETVQVPNEQAFPQAGP